MRNKYVHQTQNVDVAGHKSSERAVPPDQGVNPSDLCFGIHSLGQEDARLHCDVLRGSHP